MRCCDVMGLLAQNFKITQTNQSRKKGKERGKYLFTSCWNVTPDALRTVYAVRVR